MSLHVIVSFGSYYPKATGQIEFTLRLIKPDNLYNLVGGRPKYLQLSNTMKYMKFHILAQLKVQDASGVIETVILHALHSLQVCDVIEDEKRGS